MASDDVTAKRSAGAVTRRHFLCAAGASAALAAWRPRAGVAADREIKIGYVTPRTGPLAGFAEADDFILGGLEKRFKEGVAIGGGRHPVKILVKDSQSSPNRAAEVASELILSGKVDLMLVASTPETTNPVGDQCELNEVP